MAPPDGGNPRSSVGAPVYPRSSTGRNPLAKEGSSNARALDRLASMTAGAENRRRESKSGFSRLGRSQSKTRASISGKGRQAEVILDVRVLDEHGVDVTPKPLTTTARSHVLHVAMGAAGGESTPTSEASDVMGGRMSSSGFSLRNSSTFDRSNAGTPEPPEEEEPDEAAEEERLRREAAREAHYTVAKEEPPRRPADLEREHTVTLQETATFFLFDMPARCVQADSAEAPGVKESNERYRKVCQKHAEGEAGSDNVSQTLNAIRKSRDAQTEEKPPTEVGCQTTEAAIFDAATGSEGADGERDKEAAPAPAPAGVTAATPTAEQLAAGVTTGALPLAHHVKGHGKTPDGAARASSSQSTTGLGDMGRRASVMSVMSAVSDGPERPSDVGGGGGALGDPPPSADPAAAGAEGAAAPEEALVPLDSFANMGHALSVMERVVLQNNYHDRLLMYRGYRLSKPNVLPNAKRALKHLWDFSCAATVGRNVSCVALNTATEDLVAVAYGEYAFLRQRPGLVAFWSLKNPEHPLLTFEAPCGVTSLDFSTLTPNLLAVGRYDGTVAIYDVRARDKAVPMLESTLASGQHSDPVWNLKWVRRGSSEEGSATEELLVSISTDGRVVQWSISKGLDHIELMTLKRAVNGLAAPKKEAIVSRRAPGMCFDFSARDSSTYLVGTEDGGLHRCSVSDSEQYLTSYHGHGGPVYSCQWAPFVERIFLSASADGTAKLWREENSEPLLTFQSEDSQGEVADVAWSKTNSTVFGTVTSDGRLEIWDISESVLKPSLTHIMDGYRLSCISFAESSPVVMVGNDSGTVSVFRLVGVENPEELIREQPVRLREALFGHEKSSGH